MFVIKEIQVKNNKRTQLTNSVIYDGSHPKLVFAFEHL